MRQIRTIGGATLVCFAAFIAAFFVLTPFAHATVPAPTLLSPSQRYALPPDMKLSVRGLAPRNAKVYFFLDGKLVGGVKAKNGKGRKTVASFNFRYANAKIGFGGHTVHAQAIVGTEKSIYTSDLAFTKPVTWSRRVDGLIVPYAKANVVPLEVMIENLSVVRPQAGLGSASVVYETLAEGGIPRFLAVFVQDDMKYVGPIRSARPYFVQWAKEYDGPYLHAGGSQDALGEIRRWKLADIEALKGATSKYFVRLGAENDVHALFTNKAKLDALKKTLGLAKKKATFTAWAFKDEPPLARRPTTKKMLTADFGSGRTNIVTWEYKRASNSYARTDGGLPHKDKNYVPARQLYAKNVVVQLVPKERVLDSKGRLGLTIMGQGTGWLMEDGSLQAITWKKDKGDGRTRFFLRNGTPVQFNRGSTWIEVVPKNHTVLYTAAGVSKRLVHQ